MANLLMSLLLIFWSPVQAGPDVAPTADPAAESQTTFMVFGSPHLRQRPRDAVPVAVDVVRWSLSRFEPDHIVVEWLHPSIDASTTFNYRPRGDRETLARLWGIPLDSVDERLRTAVSWLDEAKSLELPTAELRIHLGKLRYLTNDQLNAGYQWWRADLEGGGVGDLENLTRGNFHGHELRELGFELARRHDLEYLTPFDYQGPEAGTGVWGEMLSRLRTTALARVDGLEEGAPGWRAAVERFDSLRRAFEREGDPRFEESYGGVREVAEYIETWRGFGREAELTPVETDGLTLVRWFQSPEYEASERRIQTELIPAISIDGLGRARWRGIHRRNELMVDFIEADLRRLGAARVLIIVGAGHKFDLEEILRERGYGVVPSGDFIRGAPFASHRYSWHNQGYCRSGHSLPVCDRAVPDQGSPS